MNITPRAVIISAWAIPVMVAGQFAMLAIIPLGIAAAGILRNRQLHGLRGWVAAVSAAYGAGLLMWAIGPDRAPSLSKELHPAHEVVITALGVALALAYHLTQRRSRQLSPSA